MKMNFLGIALITLAFATNGFADQAKPALAAYLSEQYTNKTKHLDESLEKLIDAHAFQRRAGYPDSTVFSRASDLLTQKGELRILEEKIKAAGGQVPKLELTGTSSAVKAKLRVLTKLDKISHTQTYGFQRLVERRAIVNDFLHWSANSLREEISNRPISHKNSFRDLSISRNLRAVEDIKLSEVPTKMRKAAAEALNLRRDLDRALAAAKRKIGLLSAVVVSGGVAWTTVANQSTDSPEISQNRLKLVAPVDAGSEHPDSDKKKAGSGQ